MEFKEFESLSSKEMDDFKRVCSNLLSRTFVVRTKYVQDKGKVDNPDYFFLTTHRELVESYLDILNWKLHHDDYNGYFYVSSTDVVNKLKLDFKETAVLLGLRLIYDENQDEVGLEDDVLTTVRDVLDKIVVVHPILPAKPNMNEVQRILNLFDRFSIIERIDGYYTNPTCKFAILPTILTAVSGEKIDAVATMLRNEGEDNEKVDEDTAD